ncbi:hypothetical protein H6P81_003934 [Aristolochia fimbriata]|uniref:Uncharacterized protein n=1 Tax=Aristolochia fimbriata TaxID=158543 RepID=A0AAV7FF22_ARIFI|nr:hypothetical protein H6P81_003934 [Aristolochia fimbriata]
MAYNHFFLEYCSLVFFLLLAGARGSDSYYGSSADPKPSTPDDQPKAEYERPSYEQPKPLPVYDEKPKADFEKIKPHFQKPGQKADQYADQPSVPTKPAYEKPKVDYEKIKPDYETPKQKVEYSYEKPTPKPAYEKPPKVDYEKVKPASEKPKVDYKKVKPTYVKPKVDYEKVKPIYEKPKVDYTEVKPTYEKPKVDYDKAKPTYEKPKVDYEKPKVDYEKVKPKGDYEKSSQKLQYDKFTSKPVYEKPDQIKVEYYTKPSVTKPGYNYEKTKVEYEKIKPDYEKEKSKVDYYKSTQNVPKAAYEKPKVDYGRHLDKIMGLQGLVYCRRSAAHLEPLQGAVVRVTCLITKSESNGYESREPVSFLCNPTNEKGYFFMTKKVSELERSGKKVGECKAFLHHSPCDTCNVPTDAYNGVTGAPLKSHRLSPHNDMQLFSVGPFIYTPKPEAPAASKGGAY